MMQRTIIAGLILASLAIAIACGGDDGGDGGREIRPISGNTEVVVGENRLAFQLVDDVGEPIQEAPDTSVHMQFLLNDEVQSETDASWVWAIEDVTGFWVTYVDFPQQGEWSATATLTEGEDESAVDFSFQVTETGNAPIIGQDAPPSENLTADAVSNLARISTDEDPDPSFYELTIAEAIDAGEPFVVVFATPEFCTSRFCGPVLDHVKEVRPEFPNVNFIHIEPFELTDEGDLVEDADNLPVPADTTTEWNLQTEPWVFIVGADGKIAQRFEGSASAEELEQALSEVAG